MAYDPGRRDPEAKLPYEHEWCFEIGKGSTLCKDTEPHVRSCAAPTPGMLRALASVSNPRRSGSPTQPPPPEADANSAINPKEVSVTRGGPGNKAARRTPPPRLGRCEQRAGFFGGGAIGEQREAGGAAAAHPGQQRARQPAEPREDRGDLRHEADRGFGQIIAARYQCTGEGRRLCLALARTVRHGRTGRAGRRIPRRSAALCAD